jgi:hypothetical protein
MAAVVYLKRRCETCPEPVSSSDGVPIQRAEWLATIARDPTLVLRPEIECGCAEWLGGGSVEAGPVARTGGEDAAVQPTPRLVFHRRGALEVSSGDRGLVAKLVEIADGLGPRGAEGEDGLYLGICVPRTDDSAPELHTGLGFLLDLALSRAPAHRPGRKRPGPG